MTRDELEAKLVANREIDANGCWIWMAAKMPGQFRYGVLRAVGLRARSDTVLAHRAAAYVWLDFDLESPLCILHRCDNPPCFNPEHLFVGTRADNMADKMRKGRYRLGRRYKGSQNARSKLTEDQVREIRRLRDRGHTHVDIAARFGVTASLIGSIGRRETWTHI